VEAPAVILLIICPSNERVSPSTIFKWNVTCCDELSLENFDRMGVSHPATKIKLLKNLNLSLCHCLHKASRELSLFY
jgi:hypothetical protein